MKVEIFLEHLMTLIDETIIPLVVLWAAYQTRKWLRGELEPPPHKVSLMDQRAEPPAADHKP